MVKSKSKKSRGKNSKGKKNANVSKKLLEFKTDMQEYAVITKVLGNRRFNALCYDGKNRLCIARGKMKRRVWIRNGDTVLLSLREYQDDKADIILKYSDQETRDLIIYGEITNLNKINEEVECAFEFTNEV